MPKRCVQCGLPGVAMVDIVSAHAFPARKGWELTVETMSAKEAKNRVACSGNHLGYSEMRQAEDCSADSVAIRSR